jgi:hypothetical protein
VEIESLIIAHTAYNKQRAKGLPQAQHKPFARLSDVIGNAAQEGDINDKTIFNGPRK